MSRTIQVYGVSPALRHAIWPGGELLLVRGQQLLGDRLGIGHRRAEPERQHRRGRDSPIQQLLVGPEILRPSWRVGQVDLTHQRRDGAGPDDLHLRGRIGDPLGAGHRLHVVRHDAVDITSALRRGGRYPGGVAAGI
jgi:hypothetical protein